MDRITKYKKILRQLFEKQAAMMKPIHKETVIQLVIDEEHGHYLLYHNTWRNSRRNYGCVLHISIRNNKIYIEHDGGDRGFALDLLEAGIPKSDIVLAFHSPEKRPYTEFAVA
ncbi:MAG: XisI protein [Saprospiraceae bacterium]